MRNVRLILVGGFLGAGKTTLLWESARRLTAQGKRVGLITNDQAPDLVDTTLLQLQGHHVREVAGSCFCCNFQGLLDAAEGLRNDIGADILLAEPVGSCTDLSATIVQPLKDRYAGDFTVAPLTVLADPIRLEATLKGEYGNLHHSAVYIYRKQLEEADWIVISKADQISAEKRRGIEERLKAAYPRPAMKWLAAKTGEGLDTWLAAALEDTGAGAFIPEIDYDTYAEGEAVLGWLNADVSLTSNPPFDVNRFCREFLQRLQQSLQREQAETGHAKIILAASDQLVTGNLTQTNEDIVIRGRIDQPVSHGKLVINLRVQMSPEHLETLCRETLAALAVAPLNARVETMTSLSPGRPVPTHRYSQIV